MTIELTHDIVLSQRVYLLLPGDEESQRQCFESEDGDTDAEGDDGCESE